jgi:hypothetical protein
MHTFIVDYYEYDNCQRFELRGLSKKDAAKLWEIVSKASKDESNNSHISNYQIRDTNEG